MTFDEAMAKVGTYLKNNSLNNSLNNDKFFYIILNDLRQEYVPTIEMTFEEHEYFKTFRYTDSSFTQLSESIMKQGDLVKFGLKSTPLYLMGLPEEQLMQAWLHPESIKVLGEQNNEF